MAALRSAARLPYERGIQRTGLRSREIKGHLASAETPWLVIALVFAIIYIGEFSFALVGLRLAVARLVLLALAPCALIVYGR